MLQYLPVSTSIATYYPNLAPDDTRWSWVQPAHPDYANWMLLNLNPDGPVRFGYACAAGLGGNITAPSGFSPAPGMPGGLAPTVPWYSIQAMNQRIPTARRSTTRRSRPTTSSSRRTPTSRRRLT